MNSLAAKLWIILAARVSLLGLFLVCSLMIPAVPLAQPDSPPSLEAVINFSPRDLEITDDGVYHHIRLRHATLDEMRDHAGQPQLPVLARLFLLPPDRAVASLEIVPLERHVLQGHYRPFPILTDSLDAPPDSPPWEEIVYPRRTGFLVSAGQARRYRLAKIQFWPLEYDAATEQLTIFTAVQLRLQLRDLTQEEEENSPHIRRPDRLDDPLFRQRAWIAETVLNPDALERYYPLYAEEPTGDPTQARPSAERSVPHGTFISDWPSEEGLPADYVIVTNNVDEFGNDVGNMQAVWEAYAALRTNLGLPTTVKTVDAIEGRYSGFDRPMRIRNFLRECLELWGTTYVLLAGDDAVVPTRRLGGPSQSWVRPDPPADIWYSFVYGESDNLWNNVLDSWLGQNSTDIGADDTGATGFSSLLVSRLPAKNADEAQAIVSKIWAYMTDPPSDQDFYRTATIASGMVNSPYPDNNSCGVYLCEEHIVPPLEASPLNWIINKEYPHLGKVLKSGCPPFQDVCYGQLYQYIEREIAPDTTHWWGDDLRDRLNSGTHFLYHVEHSMRDRLGRPSAYYDRPPCTGYPNWDPDSLCRGDLEYYLTRNIEHMDINEALALANGLSQSKYSIIFSSGSWTNMADMDAIGEAFLRAPEGGAIAYVGKTATFGDATGTYYPVFETAVEKILGSATEGIPLVQSWYEALWETASGSEFEQIKAGAILQVLADPTLCPLKRAYQALAVDISPSPVTTLGIQSVTAEVTEEGSGTPVAGAIVCLRQGDLLYATALTDDDGEARFQGALIQDAVDSLNVTAYKGGLAPAEIIVDVQPSNAFVGYSSHEMDDCVTGGDCDDVLEVGETAELGVTLKNMGTAASGQGFAVLRPTPSVTMRLTINDEYRRKDTLLGKESANPPVGTDLFRVPLSIEGTRLEGEPAAPGTLTRESFRVWRAEGSGLYTIGAVSPSHSADTVFTGILKGAADFSSVSKTGEANDTYFWSGDSIWFSFHGDASEDRLTFKAEAPNWLTLGTSSAALAALQPGDSATVTFSATILDEVPDRSNLVFTVTAYHGLFGTTYYHSDFVEGTSRPVIDLAALDKDFGDFGCVDTTWRWTPTIVNAGSARADSVILTLRRTAGTLTVLDSVVTYYSIGPDSVTSSGSFLMCGSSPADTSGFRATIKQETYHKEFYELAEHDGGGGGSFDGPDNLRADLLDGTVVLRWDPTVTGTGYCIEYGTSEGGPRHFLDRIGREAMRYEVAIPLESGPYWFYVSCANGGVCGERSVVGPVYPWVHEREGWPVLLPEMPLCAPLVADLGYFIEGMGKAIFAATDKIFCWRPDGSGIRINGSSVFYEDPNLPERSAEQRFIGAMVYGNWNTATADPEIGGNLWKAGTYLVKISCDPDPNDGGCWPTLVWKKSISSPRSPVVASGIQPANRRVLFLSGMRYPPDRIYAWDANPSGGHIGNASDQFVTSYPNGSAYNWENLAIGYTTVGTPHHDLIATTSANPNNPDPGGHVYCFSAYDLTNPATKLWELSLGDGRWVSTPAVGDIDADDNHDHEVVVTTMGTQADGTAIYVIDENDGLVVTSAQVSDWYAMRDETGEPPCGPALVQLDTDAPLEIVVADNPCVGGSAYARDIKVHVFDLVDGSLVHYSAMMQIPYTQRNEEYSATYNLRQAAAPIGTPIVGDYDYNGSTVEPDILVTTMSGAIAAFEYIPGVNPQLSPKPGWPLLLQDTPLPPVLAELDPDGDPGQFSLVTLCQDGWLHVFDLPMADEDAPDPEWAAYGRDGGNRRARLNGGAVAPPQGPELTTKITGVGIGAIKPEPTSRGQDIAVATPTRIRVELGVYDVSGRRVRQLHDGPIEAGETTLYWDGRGESGHPVASGVYWYRLTWPSGSESRRMVLIR